MAHRDLPRAHRGRAGVLTQSAAGGGAVSEDRAAIADDESSITRIGALDGIRGLAIILVLVYHYARSAKQLGFESAILSVANIGWTGVDLFFVLSGFLITGILYESRKAAHYFVNFYARRILRIFPVYYVAILTVLLLSIVWPEARFLGTHSLGWIAVYLTNVLMAVESDAAVPRALTHFWSLAVEEHFYLMWPFIVLLGPRRVLMAVAAGFIALGLGLRVASHLTGLLDAWDLFLLTPTRMDGLAVGALCALAVRGPDGIAAVVRPAWVAALGGGAGLLIMLALTRTSSQIDPAMQLIGYTLLAVTFGGFLVVGISWRPLNFILNLKILTWFGRYSYGMYVWHQVVNAVFFFSPMTAVIVAQGPAVQVPYFLAAVATGLVVTLVSYHFWEVPFLHLKKHFRSRVA